MHTIKPLDTQAIDINQNYKLIVTVEEHSVFGGLGSAVAEHLIKKKTHVPQLIIGVEDFFPHAGSYQYLIEKCGLTASQIKERIAKAL
jgi:transketolase